MNFFLIMIAPILIVVFSIFILFWWGAKGKESYKNSITAVRKTYNSPGQGKETNN